MSITATATAMLGIMTRISVTVRTANHDHIPVKMTQPLKTESTTTQQPFYGSFSTTTKVRRCQKRTSGLCGARED